MSRLQGNLPTTISQNGLYIGELVTENLARMAGNGAPLYLAPLIDSTTNQALSYYGKPIAVTTEDTKGLRKLSRLFNQLAAQGDIPIAPSSSVALEWGFPDSMRLAFFPLLGAFVHAKAFSLSNAEAPTTLPGARERVFVTGTCMYGKDGVVGLTDKQKTLSLVDPYVTPTATYEEYGCITSLNIKDDFHIYEIVEALSRGNILNGIKADTIYFNVPVTPYVLYAKEAISRGIMDQSLLGTWVAQLKKRAGKMIAYEQSICHGRIIPVDPLYSYIDAICDPQMDITSLTGLLSDNDSWWKIYLTLNPPSKFADIGSASYARVYYDLLAFSSGPRTLCAVEDQTEMRILLETKKLIDSKAFPLPDCQNTLLGLYPFSPVIFPDATGQTNATFFADHVGNKQSTDAVFALCRRFADAQLVDKAQMAYTAIQSGVLGSNYSFNMV